MPAATPKGPLARKLDRLFQTVHPPGRGEYSFEDVAEAIRARGGPTISATYLWQLRKGLRDNPTKHHLEALADCFGVTPAYFFDEPATEHLDAQLDLLLAWRHADIRAVAIRLSGLSPGSLRAIATIVEQLRRLEALPEPGDPPPPRRGPKPKGAGAGPPPPPPAGGDAAEELDASLQGANRDASLASPPPD